MSTAGARHLAESQQWLHAEAQARLVAIAESATRVARERATLFEAAAAHDRVDPIDWLVRFFWAQVGRIGTAGCGAVTAR